MMASMPAMSSLLVESMTSVPDEAVDSAVSAVRLGLERILLPIEGVFLDMGEHLGHSISALQQVSAAFDRVASAVNSDQLHEAARDLGWVVTLLGEGMARRKDESRALVRLGDLTETLSRNLLHLRKTVGEVHLLAMNGRIEAAQVVAAGIDFHVFTGGIGRLADNAMALLDSMGQELSRLAEFIALAHTEHRVFDHGEASALPEVERRLDGSRAALEGRQRALVSVAQRISAISRANEERIAKAIGCLQIGDITRQRLEHVHQALGALSQGAPTVGAVGICRLQTQQLIDIHRDGHLALTEIGAHLEAITQGAGGIVGAVQKGLLSGDADGPPFLRQLVTDLGAAHELVRQYTAAGSSLQQRLVPITEVVSQLRNYVEGIRSLEADMRIMGLNATFKCARLGGKGRVLAVIAQELRALAGRTAEDAVTIMSGLGGIYDTAQLLANDGGNGLVQAEDALERSVDVFTHGAVALSDALDGVDHGVERCLAGIAAASAILKEELAQLDRLTEWGGMLSDSVRDSADDADPSWRIQGNLLAAGYSMARQRDVHARYAGDGPAPNETAAAADIDDFLF